MLKLSRILPLALVLGLLAGPVASAQSFMPDALPAPALDGFGRAVAVGDGVVFVGEADNMYAPGTVYVYRRGADGTWAEAAQLTASDAADNDGFGADLAVDGNTLAVSGSGAVYVFQADAAGTWSETSRLPVEATGGTTLALAGDNLLVGAPSREGGAVYAFRRGAGGAWTAGDTLAPAEATPAFGAAIGLANGRALVGAPMADGRTGAVYGFTWENGTWGEAARVVASAGEQAGLGAAIAVAGDDALVSAPGAAERAGAVYTFTWDENEGTWSEQRRLVAFDAAPGYRFGSALAFDGTEAWVGAPGASRLAGTAYVFRRAGADGDWLAAEKLKAGALHTRDFFASTLDAANGVAVVGVTGAQYGTGAAVIFEQGDATQVGAWQEITRLQSEHRGLDAMVGEQTLCEDGSAGRFGCEGVDLVSFMPITAIGGERGVRLNDIWGWTDPSNGKEYALVGRIDGTSFVDISDPYNPVYVGNLPRTEGSPAASWRDIKVYQDHAFVVADASGAHGMQVFDLTQLRAFEGEPLTFEPTARYTGINSAHNIVINEDTGFAYAVGASGGGETCGGGLHMINIQNPTSPTFAGCFADPSTGRAGTGYSHDAQCVTYHGPDADYRGREICLGSNETALSIADVTDKENPVALSTAEYPNYAYTHQGWLTDDHRYFFVNDELDELQQKVEGTRTLIWDVSDLNDPQLVKEYYFGNRASDHNLYIRGNLMYQSNYASGLRIHDITDPENPRPAGHFDTVPVGEDAPGFDGSWSNYPFFESGVIAVSSIGEGLFIVRRKDVDI